jgi:hypothetical protein
MPSPRRHVRSAAVAALLLLTSCEKKPPALPGEAEAGKGEASVLRPFGGGPAETPIDPRMLGVWRATVVNAQGEWTMVFRPQKDGSFRTSIGGPAQLPDETGVMSARDGRYQLRNGHGVPDGGTYSFQDDDHLTFIGGNGIPVSWTRIGPAGP